MTYRKGVAGLHSIATSSDILLSELMARPQVEPGDMYCPIPVSSAHTLCWQLG